MIDDKYPRHNASQLPAPFVDHQLLLTGQATKIDAFVARLQERGVDLKLLNDLPVHFLDATIRLYQYEGNVEALASEIAIEAEKHGIAVDLNYRISATPWTVGGSPWTVGGSPWTVGGSPWTVGGSPWTVGGSPWRITSGHDGEKLRQQTTEIFYEQWAFGPDGIDAPVGANAPASAGKGVRVGIFDASPFPVTMSEVTVNMTPDLSLALLHPMPGGACTLGPAGNVADHGLFVAGLIHAIAPAAELQLIRVLDDAVQGDLFILLAALTDFISGVKADQKALCGAVINLSLGLVGSSGASAGGSPHALHMLLKAATKSEIVVIAAAGNDSAGEPTPLGSQIPASWDFVLGVGASNRAGNRSCFSNTADVLAPGGDGHCSCCQPAIEKCHGKDCDYALISLATSSYTGYAYGVGSSFATPLVSGLAAAIQALECRTSPCDLLERFTNNATETGLVSCQAIRR